MPSRPCSPPDRTWSRMSSTGSSTRPVGPITKTRPSWSAMYSACSPGRVVAATGAGTAATSVSATATSASGGAAEVAGGALVVGAVVVSSAVAVGLVVVVGAGETTVPPGAGSPPVTVLSSDDPLSTSSSSSSLEQAPSTVATTRATPSSGRAATWGVRLRGVMAGKATAGPGAVDRGGTGTGHGGDGRPPTIP